VIGTSSPAKKLINAGKEDVWPRNPQRAWIEGCFQRLFHQEKRLDHAALARAVCAG
jgi:hypothetical protein